MLFNSSIFAVFLVTVLFVHWALVRRRARNLWLLAASYVFYGWWDWRFVALLILSSSIDYFAGIAIEDSPVPSRRRLLLFVSCGANLTILIFFKYFNFFSENLRLGLTTFGLRPTWPLLHIILPVGVSFYTFQAMTYTIDVYRRVIRPCRDYPDFLLFVAYFPQLVAGPIEKARNLLPQIERPRWFDPAMASEAIPYIAIGYVLKTVVADNLAGVVGAAYGDVAARSGLELLLATYAFAFQIYGDFAGYTYIAIGISLLFGIRLSQNFRSPYLSQSIKEFWTRWHISLSSWFREYFYITIGGNRGPKWRHRFNIVATFVVSGLWHGANWTYITWGFVNGIGYFLPRSFPERRVIGRVLNTVVTFHIVCAAWVFFRARNVSDALLVFHRLATNFWPASSENGPNFTTIIHLYGWRLAMIGCVVAVEVLQRNASDLPRIYRWPSGLRYAFYAGLAVVYFYRGEFSRIPFIYFQF